MSGDAGFLGNLPSFVPTLFYVLVEVRIGVGCFALLVRLTSTIKSVVPLRFSFRRIRIKRTSPGGAGFFGGLPSPAPTVFLVFVEVRIVAHCFSLPIRLIPAIETGPKAPIA